VDAGADYIVTQLFFDNRDFFDFRERCALADIHIPIIAGIMPVTSMSGFKRIAELAGARASRPSFCVLFNDAKTILKWSGASAFTSPWNNVTIFWITTWPAFTFTRSIAPTPRG
jgi:5,10-methylenetetrahydrofolate reductase